MEHKSPQEIMTDPLNTWARGLLHQLSQPMAAIYGIAQFFRQTIEPSSPLIKGVDLLEQQSDELKKIISELQSLVRPHTIQVKEFSFMDSIDVALFLMSDVWKMKKIHLQFERPLVPVIVLGDDVTFHRVLMDIFLNTIQEQSQESAIKMKLEIDEEKVNVMIASERISNPNAFKLYLTKITMPEGQGFRACQEAMELTGVKLETDDSNGVFKFIFPVPEQTE